MTAGPLPLRLLVASPGPPSVIRTIESFETFRGVGMNEQAQTDNPTQRDFHLVSRGNGLVLRGHVHTYYAKQLVSVEVSP
jgi:hypothetical protein